MSHVSVKGDQSTSQETLALTSLTNLATSSATQVITKTGANTFANIEMTAVIGTAVVSATAGSVLFAGTAGVLAQNNANFFWDNTNNRLGVGVTPTNALNIKGAGTDGETIASFYGNSSTIGTFVIKSRTGALPGINIGTVGGGEKFGFNTAGVERMLIDASGNLQIGSLLGATRTKLFVSSSVSGSNTDGISVAKIEASGYLDTGEEIGRFMWYSLRQGGTAGGDLGAYISASADGSWTTGQNPTKMGFFTTPTGSTTPLERLSITQSGEIRFVYDSSNYFSAIVSSTGSTTFALAGTTPTFTFSQAVNAYSVKATQAAGFISSDNSAGITTTITTADLVGKTITIKDGIITGFA